MFYAWIKWQIEASGINLVKLYIEKRQGSVNPLIIVCGDNTKYPSKELQSIGALIEVEPVFPLELKYYIPSILGLNTRKKEHNWKKKKYFGKAQ